MTTNRSDRDRARTLCAEVNAMFGGTTRQRLGHGQALDILARCDGYANHHVVAAMRASAETAAPPTHEPTGTAANAERTKTQDPETSQEQPGRVTAADYVSMHESLLAFTVSAIRPIAEQRQAYEKRCVTQARLLSRLVVLRTSAQNASRNLGTLLGDVIAAHHGMDHGMMRSLALTYRHDEQLQEIVRDKLDDESCEALRAVRLGIPGGTTTQSTARERFDRVLARVVQKEMRQRSVIPAEILAGADIPTVGEEIVRRVTDDRSIEANLQGDVLHGTWRLTPIVETEQMREMPPVRTPDQAKAMVYIAGMPAGMITATFGNRPRLSLQDLHDVAVIDYLVYAASQPPHDAPVAPSWVGWDADHESHRFTMRYENG